MSRIFRVGSSIALFVSLLPSLRPLERASWVADFERPSSSSSFSLAFLRRAVSSSENSRHFCTDATCVTTVGNPLRCWHFRFKRAGWSVTSKLSVLTNPCSSPWFTSNDTPTPICIPLSRDSPNDISELHRVKLCTFRGVKRFLIAERFFHEFFVSVKSFF